MGLGGHLMWTPLARELAKLHPGHRMLPFEAFGSENRIVKSDIFKGNPNFCESHNEKAIAVCLNASRTNYCKFDSYEKCIQRCDKHVIQQICDAYGIGDVALKCDLFLDESELIPAADLVLKYRKFVTIDPHVKNEYTVNKEYPLEKWQCVVDKLLKSFQVVQIGQKTNRILNGCIDMTGQTTFREAAGIIQKSMLFVGSEGGLMHAANAVGTQAVIVVTGFLHPRMTCYEENTNIWLGFAHGPCGMKVKCEKCYNECLQHDENEIVESVFKRLKL